MNQEKRKGGWALSSFKSLLSRNYLLLIVISIFNQFGTTMDTQLITVWGTDLGMAATTITLMATLYSVATMVGRPFAGRLTDKLNLKFWLILIMILKAGTFVLQGIAPNPVFLMVARFCTGIVFCFITTAVATMGSLFVDRRAMATGMGVLNAIPGLFVSTAPVIAVQIYQSVSPTASYLAAAAASIPCIIVALFLKVNKPEPKADAPEKGAAKKGFNINNYICLPALPVCLITFCTASLLFACSLLVVTMSIERGLVNIAIFFSMYTLFKTVGGIAGGVLGDLLSAKRVLVPGLLLNAICCVLLATGHTEVAIGTAGALYAISYQGIMTVTKKAAAIMAPPEQRGAAISTNMLVIDIAGITGSLIPGLLNANFGYTTTFFCMLVYPVVGLLIYLAIAKKLAAAERAQ